MLVDASVVDNLYVKSITYEKKGEFMQQHVHTYDHAHLVGHGDILVECEGVDDKVYRAGDIINIKKHKSHKLICLSDSAVSFCIHSLKIKEDGTYESIGSVSV